MPREVEHVVVVQPALHDDVDFDRQTGRGRCVDPVEYALDREVDVVHGAEGCVVERVEAHRDPTQTGVGELLRLVREQRPVRGEREIQVVDRGKQLDEPLDVAAYERLAARDADLAHAVGHERSREALDLLEGEQLRAREELVLAAEDLLRHAVHAAEVAAVGDRDAQVVHRAPERVT